VSSLETQPEPLEDLREVWRCFSELDESRTYGMNGGNPIGPGDVANWCRVNGYSDIDFTRETWVLVHRLDVHRLKAARAKADADPGRNHQPRRG